MKKDMGGAATVLGLAHMIMGLGIAVQLRVLVPAVENGIDGNAFRPQDILTSRKGLTVEINNTDAEGRLVLADALTLSDEDTPDLVISMATLTGAARVAVGPDIAPYFTDNDAHAHALDQAGRHVADPVWRLPFYTPYEGMIEDFKSPDVMSLPFGARVTVIDERRKFYETDAGFIPKSHLRSIDRPFTDPATVAQMHFGVPYLWGGNSTRGIDCSGLVAAGLTACATDCPADSDLQMAALGTDATGPYQRGDIVFWKGHVGMMVDADTMIHANAHHMATAYEPIARAILRIKAQGDGDMLAHRRL